MQCKPVPREGDGGMAHTRSAGFSGFVEAKIAHLEDFLT
jgi:hypothetical protein